MKRWLSSLFFSVACAASAVHSGGALAMPAPAAEDDMSRFVADKGLLTRLEQATHTVRDRASELVFTAMGFLGVPYRRGGNSVATGFDCSGFVRAMYEQTVGLILPRRANEQAAALQPISKQELQPGDLVFFNTMRRAFSHVGIYVGEGKFIHSPKPGSEVRVESMAGSYWQNRFDGARRVYSSAPTAAVVLPRPVPTVAEPAPTPVPLLP